MDQIRISDVNATMAAKRSFESILEKIQASNLNFQLKLSPFSANISLKKSLIRDKHGNFLLPPSSTLLEPDHNHDDKQLLEEQNSFLVSENVRQNQEIQGLKAACKSYSETVEILDKKTANIEASALKSFEDRKTEEAALRKSLKTLNLDNEGYRKDLQTKNKYIKEKEKEVYKLEQKCENLASNLKNSKSENNNVKSKNLKLLKKQKQAKSKSSRSVSTNTIPLDMSGTSSRDSVGSGTITSYTSSLPSTQDSSSSLFSTRRTTKAALSPTSSSTSMISNISSKSINTTTSQDIVAPSKCSLVSQLEESNNNSIAATKIEDNLEHSDIESKEEAKTFLTVEGVSAIIEKAMKKQRADIKVLAY